ncbi:MAG TPA: adenylate/guanylate cyclase domain-containing protein [Pseudonocardia sp.]|nr:adenylate/guanylate cyclase domain-containing protein [Pseudonocardia sp.]
MTDAPTSLRHELRTPLNAIIGYSAMLLDDLNGGTDQTDDLAPYLQRIHRAGGLLLDRLNALFDTAGGAAPDWQVGSHELRTPLAGVLGYAEMIQENPGLDDAAAADVARIEVAGRTLLALIDRLDHDSAALTAAPGGREPVTATREHAPQEPAALLVVDDNPMNRDILARRLRRLGHNVTLAENGLDALDALRRGPFDLVLLDILMPEMDGYGVLEHLRADADLRHLPVLVLSALDDIDAVARCLEMGAVDYLPKPFNPVVLRARVGACLENKRLHDAEVRHLAQVEFERRRADGLLHVILPDAIVTELKASDAVAPRRHDDVAVLFVDVAGFTRYCDDRPPEEVLANLQDLVVRYEEIAVRHGLQKIKTIGDAFLAVAGVPERVDEPVLAAARCGLEMVAAARDLPRVEWRVRVGIHCGPVVAGILGRRQYGYDVWGDTVNTAARVEHHGVVDAVALSGAAWDRIRARAQGTPLGIVPAKGKDGLRVHRLLALT